MSENFEKVVLEKLENLEKGQILTNERLDNMENNQKVVNERLDGIENNQKVVNERLDGIENNQREIYERVSNVEYNQNNMSGDITFLSRNHQTLERKLNALTVEQKDTQEVVKLNTSLIIKLETNLTDQIKGLYDARSVNDDKHKEIEDSIENLSSKVFNIEVDNFAIKKELKALKEA